MPPANPKATRRRTAGHRSTRKREERWPDLAPLYGVQFRRSGHAITFTEDERGEAERLVSIGKPGERRLVVARWTAART